MRSSLTLLGAVITVIKAAPQQQKRDVYTNYPYTGPAVPVVTG
jgi:hypothetical protein